MAKKPAPEDPPEAGEETSPADRADTWLTVLIFVLFVVACVAAWWIAHRQAIPGAPGAPIG